jgi:hypothetical protein
LAGGAAGLRSPAKTVRFVDEQRDPSTLQAIPSTVTLASNLLDADYPSKGFLPTNDKTVHD